MPKNEEVSLASLGIQMPYSMQAEQSVLGAALVDETVLNRLITDMEPEMFYSDQNRAIYETMRSLYTESEAVDIVTLVNALASNKTFASADDAKVYLARIAETLPSVSNVDSYFKIVKEKYQGRRLIDAARSILNETASGEDADLLLESAEQKIYDIRSGRDKSGVKTIRESILEVIDTMQKLSGADRDKFAGIPTGFNYLDTVLTGLGRSDLIILAARPGMGKTSFALNIATNVARQQKVPTIIFSLEMTCEQLSWGHCTLRRLPEWPHLREHDGGLRQGAERHSPGQHDCAVFFWRRAHGEDVRRGPHRRPEGRPRRAGRVGGGGESDRVLRGELPPPPAGGTSPAAAEEAESAAGGACPAPTWMWKRGE